MRQIPSLQVLCLRAVGGSTCNAEDTFAETKDKQPSTASRLLRSFLQRKNKNKNKIEIEMTGQEEDQDQQQQQEQETTGINCIPIARTPAIGTGSARREQASEVDLNHPWVGRYSDGNISNIGNSKDNYRLHCEFGSPALDVLQSIVDSLVELGRMDDSRLGLQYFKEWKKIVELGTHTSTANITTISATTTKIPPTKKRRKSQSQTPPKSKPKPTSLGSLSLYNAIIMEETIQAMVESQMTYNLAVLDLTGIQTLTDTLLTQVIARAPQLQRLSVKNCRRLTQKTLECLGEHSQQLYELDIGGSYNLQPSHVLELVATLPQLTELHASGLGWTDILLQDLTSLRSWKALSLGFSPYVSANGLKQALTSQSSSLESLAIPFCETVVDAALLGALGRHLPHVKALDVRGNSNLSSLTGWFDGRATIIPAVSPQPLFVLARYSGISKSNIEDTKRIHPLQATRLTCIMDSGGVGMGIQIQVQNQN